MLNIELFYALSDCIAEIGQFKIDGYEICIGGMTVHPTKKDTIYFSTDRIRGELTVTTNLIDNTAELGYIYYGINGNFCAGQVISKKRIRDRLFRVRDLLMKYGKQLADETEEYIKNVKQRTI